MERRLIETLNLQLGTDTAKIIVSAIEDLEDRVSKLEKPEKETKGVVEKPEAKVKDKKETNKVE